MPSDEEIRAQQELLFAYRRTLFVLLKQRAQITASFVPPAIATGIEDARDQIRRIKQNLREMAVPIDDQHNDEEAPLPRPEAIGNVQFGLADTAKSRYVGWYIGAFVVLVALGAVSLGLFLYIRRPTPPSVAHSSSATVQTSVPPSGTPTNTLVPPTNTLVPPTNTLVPPTAVPSVNLHIPLNTYWNEERQDIYTTAGDIGNEESIKNGYIFHMTVGYIFATQQAGTIPLNTYWNEERQDIYTTAGDVGNKEAIKNGYIFHLTVGYVYPTAP